MAASTVDQIVHLRERYPNKTPVYVEKAQDSALPDIEVKKYLVPETCTVATFLYLVRSRVHLRPEQALFFLIDGKVLPPVSASMMDLYEEHKNALGLLHFVYREESTFGSRVTVEKKS